MKRRTLLALPLFAAACSSAPPRAAPTRLHIPPVLPPAIDADGAKRFTLTMRAGSKTWGINGDFLGPTVRAARGDTVRMAVTNRLPETSTLHWHGMRLPARMDGGPHQMIEPGATWTPEWTIDQPSMTSWFHPHLHEKTAMHVYRGVAGLFLVNDSDDPAGLPDSYGVDDIPLIIQDRNSSGSVGGVDSGTFGLLGDVVLINGTRGAVFTATTSLVRFRLLNASNARVYRAGFADGRTFAVIAGDAGFLERPATVDRVKISPGERVEIVVRFAPGETVVMNSAGESERSANDIEEDDFDLLTVVAAGSLTSSPALPSALGGTPPESPPAGATVRRFALSGSEINDRDMDMTRIDEVVPAGTHEIWEIDNRTYAHNFHIHEVAFRILEIDGQPPPGYQAGPKDTVFLPKHAKARLSVRFGRHVDPTAPYMYHCHILRHEDKGMMGQFVVVEPGTEALVARTITGHHD